MQPEPTPPPTVAVPPARRPLRRFLRIVLLGLALMLLGTALSGLVVVIEVIAITSSSTAGWLSDLAYLYIPAYLLGGVGTFFALYGIALGLRETLARAPPGVPATGTQVPDPAAPPSPPDRWWSRTPVRFAIAGAILVLLGYALNGSFILLRTLQILYPAGPSFIPYFEADVLITALASVMQVVGTVLAYLGIVVALDRTIG